MHGGLIVTTRPIRRVLLAMVGAVAVVGAVVVVEAVAEAVAEASPIHTRWRCLRQ